MVLLVVVEGDHQKKRSVHFVSGLANLAHGGSAFMILSEMELKERLAVARVSRWNSILSFVGVSLTFKSRGNFRYAWDFPP
jgi:hypothetical protein